MACFEMLQQFQPSWQIVVVALDCGDAMYVQKTQDSQDCESFEQIADFSRKLFIAFPDAEHVAFAYSEGENSLKTAEYSVLKSTNGELNKETVKGFLYVFFVEIFGRTLPWGTLTGIKPVKISHEMIRREGMTPEAAAAAMTARFAVSEEKASLASCLAANEMSVVYPVDPRRVSVYIGVPLCPAKCSYCSFVSTIADKKGILSREYTVNLCREIEAFSRFFEAHHLTVDTLYIGGGTPSVLSIDELSMIFNALQGIFLHEKLREFTFESGRPETSSEDKLRLMKTVGVDRICLNPQSMNDETLRAVNRLHTCEDIKRVFHLMRDIGFDNINMDLITGLANEPAAAFYHTLDEVFALSPENITIHSLAVKKGSALKEARGHRVDQLYDVDFYRNVARRMADEGYHPYYLYRQKYTQGNGENVGYAKAGKDGIYNILMMAEHQTIVGIGAGASGKVYDAETDRFEKVFTVKDIRTYNERIDTLIDEKIDRYYSLIH